MANHVTAHNSINSVRNEMVNRTRSLQKSFQDLFSAMSCNAMKDAYVTVTINSIKTILTDIERQLCTAQQAATALAGVNRKVAQKKISFSASYSKGSHKIDINVSGAKTALENIRKTASYGDQITVLNRCKNEIASLAVADQILSSISIIEIFFPALAVGKVSKAVVVSKVKQACVDSIANAIKDINALANCINEFAGPGKRISILLNNFENCEEQVINKYRDAVAKKLLKKTSVYSDSNVPEEGILKGEVESAESVRNSLISLTGGSCKTLDDEVTRLNNIYENNYGYACKIEELKKMEGFEQGAFSSNANYNYMDYVKNYKGIAIEGAQCYAMAWMMQIELTGKKGSFCSNNKNDIKPGDVIHYHGYNTTSEHWAFVYKREGNKIYIAEGNHGSPPIVNYNSIIDLDAPKGIRLKNGTELPQFSFDGATSQNNGFGIYRV